MKTSDFSTLFNLLVASKIASTSAFLPFRPSKNSLHHIVVRDKMDKESMSYEETDASSKGLVSALTGIINFLSFDSKAPKAPGRVQDKIPTPTGNPPQTPQELMQRIRDDYVVRNYLWTGNIDLASFDKKCRFTDPTLSFEGTDQFINNLNNLVPIVNAVTGSGNTKSDLLSITLNEKEGYVQSRWNMVGSLVNIPWQPRIDVVGRTKFWYKSPGFNNTERDQEEGYQVYFYDEEWEIPAAKALLQLITPPGTIRNSNL
jgi:Uncharacterized conserved protein (DUF2358)